jgi:hypothetical protein
MQYKRIESWHSSFTQAADSNTHHLWLAEVIPDLIWEDALRSWAGPSSTRFTVC